MAALITCSLKVRIPLQKFPTRLTFQRIAVIYFSESLHLSQGIGNVVKKKDVLRDDHVNVFFVVYSLPGAQ